jgi:UDP-glucose 4-epimerase
MKSVDESVMSPLEYYRNNVGGTINLLQVMKRNNVRKLVFSSSASVYGDPKILPIKEDDCLLPKSPYARTKLHIEQMLFDLSKSEPLWSIICLRYFNPLGAHKAGLIGEELKGPPANLMPYIAEVALGRAPYLKVYGNNYETPDGTGIRDYIHVLDLAEGHLAAIKYLNEVFLMEGNLKSLFNIFNLGTGKGYSVLEVIKAFEDASGRNIPHEFFPRRIGDIGISYADPSKANEILNWRAERNISEMCISTWKHLQRI